MDLRRTARVILLDGHGRILMMKIDATGTADPAAVGEPPVMWVTLGGRIEEGETVLEAARRETIEETGFTDIEVGPTLWRGEQILEVRGRPALFDEAFVLVRARQEAWTDSGWSGSERAVIQEMRWWTVDELEDTAAIVKPPGLAGLLRPIVAGQLPTTPHRIALQEAGPA